MNTHLSTATTTGITENKVAIITGGSRGLGRNTVESLGRRGVDVIFTYRAKQQDAETVVREIEAMGRKAAAFLGQDTSAPAPRPRAAAEAGP